MKHIQYEDDDENQIIELDNEGIDHMIEGLEKLKTREPGDGVETDNIKVDKDGNLTSMAKTILLKAEDK